jgi:hypothetical protein
MQPKLACGEGRRDALGVWVGLAAALQLIPSARHGARSGSTAGAAPEGLTVAGASFRIAWLADSTAPAPPRPAGGRVRAVIVTDGGDAPGKNRTCARGLGNRCSIH